MSPFNGWTLTGYLEGPDRSVELSLWYFTWKSVRVNKKSSPGIEAQSLPLFPPQTFTSTGYQILGNQGVLRTTSGTSPAARNWGKVCKTNLSQCSYTMVFILTSVGTSYSFKIGLSERVEIHSCRIIPQTILKWHLKIPITPDIESGCEDYDLCAFITNVISSLMQQKYSQANRPRNPKYSAMLCNDQNQ